MNNLLNELSHNYHSNQQWCYHLPMRSGNFLVRVFQPATMVLLSLVSVGCTFTGERSLTTPLATQSANPPAATRRLPTEAVTQTKLPPPSATVPASTTSEPSPPALPPAQAEAGEGWTSPLDGMELLYVPAGSFRMGTLPAYAGGQPDERPQRSVELTAFWIDATEVTWNMYQRCEQDGACQLLSPLRPSWVEKDHPVIMVTWQDAANYCSWAGRRLPTEAEWEKAARGTDGRRYPWEWIGAPESGRQVRLNFCDARCPFPFASAGTDDGFPYTAPVGSFPAGASPYGAMDMSGNVWEWTADWYQQDRYRDKDEDLASGPEQGTVRVIRGGSWLETLWGGVVMTSRSANRHWGDPSLAKPDLGFRCALSGSEAESN